MRLLGWLWVHSGSRIWIGVLAIAKGVGFISVATDRARDYVIWGTVLLVFVSVCLDIAK